MTVKLSTLRPGDAFRLMLAGKVLASGSLVTLSPGAATVEIMEQREGESPRKVRQTWSLETDVERT